MYKNIFEHVSCSCSSSFFFLIHEKSFWKTFNRAKCNGRPNENETAVSLTTSLMVSVCYVYRIKCVHTGTYGREYGR